MVGVYWHVSQCDLASHIYIHVFPDKVKFEAHPIQSPTVGPKHKVHKL